MRSQDTPASRRLLLGLTALMVSLGVGACEGSHDPATSTPGRITVGIVPVADAAPLYVGLRKGFFAEENLDVEPRVMPSGSVIAASVVSGELQFGFSNTTALVIGRSRGLPVRIVSYAALGGSNEAEGASPHILVRSDGSIESLEDLEGKTVSVNAIQTDPAHLTLTASLDEQGVDHSKVKFVEIPFPAAVPALEDGRVDAITVAEPFATLGREAGHRTLIRPVIDVAPDFIVAAYFTTEEFIQRDPEVVDRFVRAMTRSLNHAARHPDDVREAIGSYTEIPPEIIAKMTFPDFSRPADLSTLQLNIDLAERYGFIEERPRLSDLLLASE